MYWNRNTSTNELLKVSVLPAPSADAASFSVSLCMVLVSDIKRDSDHVTGSINCD
jgi:hypothetical protein